jgi:hypothetical protein
MKKLDTCEGRGAKINMNIKYVKNANSNTSTHTPERRRGRKLAVDKVPRFLRSHVHTANPR